MENLSFEYRVTFDLIAPNQPLADETDWSFTPIRINCGSTIPHQDILGNVWVSDPIANNASVNALVTGIDTALGRTYKSATNVTYSVSLPRKHFYKLNLGFTEPGTSISSGRRCEVLWNNVKLAEINVRTLIGKGRHCVFNPSLIVRSSSQGLNNTLTINTLTSNSLALCCIEIIKDV